MSRVMKGPSLWSEKPISSKPGESLLHAKAPGESLLATKPSTVGKSLMHGQKRVYSLLQNAFKTKEETI